MKLTWDILMVFCFLVACTPEPCPTVTDVGAFKLSKEAKGKRFYTGFETLYFKDLSGDTIFLNSPEGLTVRDSRETGGGEQCAPGSSGNRHYRSFTEEISGVIFTSSNDEWSIKEEVRPRLDHSEFTPFPLYDYRYLIISKPNQTRRDDIFLDKMLLFERSDLLTDEEKSSIIPRFKADTIINGEAFSNLLISKSNDFFYTENDGFIGFKYEGDFYRVFKK